MPDILGQGTPPSRRPSRRIGQRQRTVKVRRSPHGRNSRAPALASRLLAHLHPDASASPHAMLGVVLACGIACTTYELRPRSLSRHGESSECAKPASSAPVGFARQGGAANIHHGRALVDGRPGVGALHRFPELDAPFPDGWAPPFPIGFACLCPSLQSRHSR